MASVTATISSGNPIIDGLLTDYHWDPAVLLRYGFPTTGGPQWSGYPFGNSEPYVNFAPLSSAQQLVAIDAFAAVESFTNMSFVNANLAGEPPEHAVFRFGRTGDAEGAHAYIPTDHEVSGDVWFANDGTYDHPVRGDYAHFAFLHEIGHALGLKHPHENEFYGVMPVAYDHMNYTVMSYRSYEGMGVDDPFHNATYGYPQTFMMYDIAALQHLYGADFTTNSGDTVYGWNPDTGHMTIDGTVRFQPGGNVIFMTLWDGGGIDTYDFSGYSSALNVSLIPGEWSITTHRQLADLGDSRFALGNIANALLYQGDLRSLIENATGGTGDDTLRGNQAANTLTGGGGADWLDGGAGADLLIGGAGDDKYFVDNAADAVVEAAGEGQDIVEVKAATYVLGENVERMVGTSSGAQSLTGNAGDNFISGNGLDGNIFNGGDGADTLFGSAGAEQLLGGAGADQIDGFDGVDTIDGGGDNDTIFAGGGGDTADGGSGDDLINGGTGSDHLFGSAGADTINGQEDADFIEGGEGNDRIRGGAYGDIIDGGAGDDFLTADGGSGDPFAGIPANSSADDAFDTDLLIGGSGADVLEAGAGEDRILYRAMTDSTDASRDRILLFQSGIDKIDLSTLPRGTLSWTELTDPSNGALYSLVSFEAAGAILRFRVDGQVALGDFILPAGPPQIIGTDGDNQLLGTAEVDEIIGNGGNDELQGLGDDDLLDGGTGNDTLDGGIGADAMTGGAGNDLFFVDISGDEVIEDAGGGIDEIRTALSSYALGVNVENLTGTSGGSQSLTGNALANVITGGAGGDTLDGGVGADQMYGLGGSDTFIVDNIGDQAIEAAGGGIDTVESSVSFTLGVEVERLTLTGTAAIDGTGNALGNIIRGTSGNNFLDGGAGVDLLVGGAGNDTYVLNEAGDSVNEQPNEGTDTVRAAFSYALGDWVENLVLLAGAVNGTGNGLANVMTGNDAANVLNGLGGADAMAGGLGDDIYVVDDGGDAITEAAGAGIDSVQSSVSLVLGANFENLTLTGIALNATGNGLNNNLTGNGSNNMLDGGAGADAMAGGNGHDTYIVDNAGDTIVEALNGGNDSVQTLVTFTLPDNVEYLTLAGAGGISGTGNGLNNIINGNGAANIINGGLGADFLTGGGGDDIYVVDNGSDKVTEAAGGGTDTVQSSVNWTLGANVERLTLTGTTALMGVGNDLDNVITGNAAANVISGGLGADAMQGGLGNDTFIVDNGGDTVQDTGGVDTVQSSVSFVLGATIDNLTLTGTDATSGIGNALWNVMIGNSGANTLDGGLGNDIIDGGAGADTLIGGQGHDTYHVDNVGDQVVDTGGGNDHVHAAIDYVLGSDLEYLTLTGSAVSGTGNAKNNLIYGNAGNNVINGGLGVDFMVGGMGDDIYYVDSGSDSITEHLNQGTDTVMSSVNHALRGNIENLTLIGTNQVIATGNTLNNVLIGNSANNILYGGLGADTMSDGGGNDVFQYRATAESTAASRDTITGFGAGDKINLSAIDAILGTPANNDAFTFIGNNAFSNVAGQLRAVQNGSSWTIEADVDGNGIADLVIGLTTEPGHILGASDFVL